MNVQNILIHYENDFSTGVTGQTYPPANFKLACRTTPPNVILGNRKNYQTKIAIICPFFYLSKPKQINKGGSFEGQICL